MKIIRAEHLGMCFGVRDAIALALKRAETERLTILGDLVHNEVVLDRLRARGIQMVNRLEDVRTQSVMITAHGASDRTMSRIRDCGLNLTQATCPLVRLVHRSVAELVQDGYYPVIVGKHNHVEVRGLTEDLADYDVILTEQDVFQIKERPLFGVVAQTTQPIDKVRHLVSLIRHRFPSSEVRFIDTVCQPTKQRQAAAIELAQQADLMLVIGGANSNNTRELAATCAGYCQRVYHVQSPAEVLPEWLADAQIIGIAAGTSTPDSLIESVETRLAEIASITSTIELEQRLS